MHTKTYVISTVIIYLLAVGTSSATNYYVHPDLGNDQNPGTSLIKPLQSLEKASTLELKPGDVILLAAGHTFYGSLELRDVAGTDEAPIVIASYSLSSALKDKRAVIDAKGYLNGISLTDCSHIIVENLIVSANGGGLKKDKRTKKSMRCGILVTTSKAGEYTNINLQNLLIRDIFFEEKGHVRGKDEVRTANGTQNYGWGIRFINSISEARLKNLTVSNCVVQNVAHTGIKFTGRNQSIHHIKVHNNRVLKTGGPGIQMSGVLVGHVKGNYVNQSGSNDDTRKWGRGSGLWTWSTSDVVIENNHFMNANGPADSAGCHIDFNCTNVVVQYNFSANNAGGFCEILGNNYNCAYRYNISVNDGHRVKGKNGAFQEGKVFWLSGYQGRDNPRKGPFNSYFYNNTIYVSKNLVAKMAIPKTASGVLVVNNIFCIEGDSKAVLGDQYKPEKPGGGDVKNVVFDNNLYLKATNWPKEVLIQDKGRTIGDPQFFRKGGLDIMDYIPKNTQLIKNKGMEIPIIPQDKIGLTIGVKAEYDILGNKITGKPDMGAIELE